MHVDAVEVVHGTRRRADDDARRRRGGIAAVLLLCVDEFAEPVRVLQVFVTDTFRSMSGIIFCCSDPFLREKVMRARKVTN